MTKSTNLTYGEAKLMTKIFHFPIIIVFITWFDSDELVLGLLEIFKSGAGEVDIDEVLHWFNR